MWIRSQEKEILTKCENVFITYDNGSYYVKNFVEKYNYFELGEYSSRGKALKVLDMIENAIGGVPETDIKGNVIGIAIKKIFQMPQDDEVQYD